MLYSLRVTFFASPVPCLKSGQAFLPVQERGALPDLFYMFPAMFKKHFRGKGHEVRPEWLPAQNPNT